VTDRTLLDHHPAVPYPGSGLRRVERGEELPDLLGGRLVCLHRRRAGDRRAHLHRTLPTLDGADRGLDQRLRAVPDERGRDAHQPERVRPERLDH